MEGLRQVWANLWPVDCQTCGQPLEPGTPASLYVADLIVFGAANVHHSKCQRPEWSLSPRTSAARYLTWRSQAFLMPTKPYEDAARPILLVNPSLEQVTIEPRQDGQWRLSHRLWDTLGLRPSSLEFIDVTQPDPVPHASARVVRDFIEVQFKDYPDVWSCSIDRAVADAVHEQGGISLALTTAVNPEDPLSYFQFGHMLASGQLHLGWITVRGAENHAPLRQVSAPAALTTYVLHWSPDHATVGPLLASTVDHLDEDQAVEWAWQHIDAPWRGPAEAEGIPIEWQPVARDRHARFLLDPLSARMYFLRRHTDGWHLVQALARSDGGVPVVAASEPAMREWAESVIRLRAKANVVDWHTAPTTDSERFITMHGFAATPSDDTVRTSSDTE